MARPDFEITGPTSKIIELKNRVATVHPIKKCTGEEHDPRHVDVLVQEFGLETGNTVQTPAVNESMSDKTEVLDATQNSRHRSQVPRCLFLSQDRADIMFTVNELRQRISNPTQQSLIKLKRLVRYLKSERQRAQKCKYGRMHAEVTHCTL